MGTPRRALTCVDHVVSDRVTVVPIAAAGSVENTHQQGGAMQPWEVPVDHEEARQGVGCSQRHVRCKGPALRKPAEDDGTWRCTRRNLCI